MSKATAFIVGAACGAVAGVAVLCWIAVKDEYALRIEWYRKGGLVDADAIQDYNVETFGQRLLIIDTAPTVIEAEGREE